MCGEAFCSRECMAKDWKTHRQICETVYDNGMIATVVTQMEMTKRLTKAEMEQCLGRRPPARRPQRSAGGDHNRPPQDAEGGLPGGADRLNEVLTNPNSTQEMRDFARMRLADETGEVLPAPTTVHTVIPQDESELEKRQRYAQCPPQWANVMSFEETGGGVDADTAVRSAAKAIMSPRGQSRHIPRMGKPDPTTPGGYDSIICYPNLMRALKSCIHRHKQGAASGGDLANLCADAYVVWAWLAQKGSSVEKSKTLISKAIDVRPDHPAQLSMRSSFHAMTDMWALALRDSLDSRKVETDPYEIWSVGDNIAKCLNQLGRVDEAIVYLEESCKAAFDTNDPIGAQYRWMDAATRGRCCGNLYLLSSLYHKRGSRADLEMAKNRFQEAEKREGKLDAKEQKAGGYGQFKMLAQLAATSQGVNSVGECNYCNQPAAKLLRCTACESAAYCSRDCQKRAWKSGHKEECAVKKLQKQEREEKRHQSRESDAQTMKLPPVDGDLNPEELWQFGCDHAAAQPDESAWCFLVSLFMDFSKTGRDMAPVKRAVRDCASGSKVAIALEPFAKKGRTSTTLPQTALEQAHRALHTTLPLHDGLPGTLADQNRDSFAAGCATLFFARCLSQAGNATLNQACVEEACRLTDRATSYVDPSRYLTMQFELGFAHRDVGACTESLRWYRMMHDTAPVRPNPHWAAMLQQAQLSIALMQRGADAEEYQRAISAVRRKRAAARDQQHTDGSVVVSQATNWKQKGNGCFSDGKYLEAAKAYTRAIDCLHQLSSAESTTLSSEVQAVLATCLSNRAECRLQLACESSREGEAERDTQGLAEAAAADCAYVQRLIQWYIPEKVRAKTESRIQRAEAILSESQPQPRSPSAPSRSAPEPEPEPPTETSGSEAYPCNRCGHVKEKAEFSGNQWKSRKKRSRGVAVGGKCKECVQLVAAERMAPPVAPAPDPAEAPSPAPVPALSPVLSPAPAPLQVEPEPQQSDSDGFDTAEEDEGAKPKPEPEPEPEPEENQRVKRRPKRLPALIKGSEVATHVRFAEDACPTCLEGWADTGEYGLADKPVVALECGHAMCLDCMHDYRKQCNIPFYTEDIDRVKHKTQWMCFCTKPLPEKKKYWNVKK